MHGYKLLWTELVPLVSCDKLPPYVLHYRHELDCQQFFKKVYYKLFFIILSAMLTRLLQGRGEAEHLKKSSILM